jgi:hypothetical protein
MTKKLIAVGQAHGLKGVLPPAEAPQSVCRCRHTGDGPESQHAGTIGYGYCTVEECPCTKFTWIEFTAYGERRMEEYRKLGRG